MTTSKTSTRRGAILAKAQTLLDLRRDLIAEQQLLEKRIGALLRDYRTAGEPTVFTTTLAEESGVHRTTIWTIETGKPWHEVTIQHVHSLFAALPALVAKAGWGGKSA